MPSLRTALLTLTAAAAAVVPAGSAAAAGPGDLTGPLPGHGLADALPTQGVTDTLPLQTVTDTLPTQAVTESLPTQSATGALHDGAAGGLGPVKHLTLDPLANTGSDPLDNAVGSQIADFQPVSTAAITGPVARGGSLSTLPLVGTAAGLLPG